MHVLVRNVSGLPAWKVASPSIVLRADHRDRKTGLVVAGVAGGLLFIGFACYLIFRLRKRHPNPKYIPTPFLKRLWQAKPNQSAHRYQHAADEEADSITPMAGRTMRTTLRQAAMRVPGRQRTAETIVDENQPTATTAAVDRNTSVRSVMTLPAYRTNATDNEQVLGREGERGGIDVVVELPTAEDEEALRENEMSTLYQIRLLRRQENEANEERRRLRREARDRNDARALEELRRQTRQARGNTEVEDLRREHERIKNSRQRAVSSVSYDGLGIARADGTRLRANSTESERMGLLSDAASIAPSARSVSAAGPSLSSHHRTRSASSVISIDTANSPPASPNLNLGGSSYGLASPGRTRSRSRSIGPSTPRAGSSPEMIDHEEADLGQADMPLHPPPEYEDVSLDDLSPQNTRSGANSPYPEPPPDYSGPRETRSNRLSAHMADEAGAGQRSHSRSSSRGVGGVPQLPSLRLSRVPQIVIEPSGAQPNH